MSVALTCSSSSATLVVRSAVRKRIAGPASSLPRAMIVPRRGVPARNYSPLPAYTEDDADEPRQSRYRPTSLSRQYDHPRSASYDHSSAQSRRQPLALKPIRTTPESAQSYLSELLHLPPDRQIPPPLALQILTHKSFRHAKLLRHSRSSPSPSPSPSPSTDPTSTPAPSSSSFSSAGGPASTLVSTEPSRLETDATEQLASHNSRLSFVGRRAIETYLALFIHSALAHIRQSTDLELRDLDFLRGRTLQEKIDALRNAQNIGREVGHPWQVADVMRWDQNPNTVASAADKIQGTTVEAIIGGAFTVYGSPAAHRAFHLYVLPHLAPQLRDPALIERAQTFHKTLMDDTGPEIIGQPGAILPEA